VGDKPRWRLRRRALGCHELDVAAALLLRGGEYDVLHDVIPVGTTRLEAPCVSESVQRRTPEKLTYPTCGNSGGQSLDAGVGKLLLRAALISPRNVFHPIRDASGSRFLFPTAGSLHLPRLPSQSNKERVQIDRICMTRLAVVVGPAREIAIRICVLLDGVDDCVQLRNRDGAVLRRCKGRRDLLRG